MRIRDGMNLVAMEYLASRRPDDPGVPAPLRFAGAARRLPYPMTRPAALERLAAHRADAFPRLVTGLRIETLRSLVVIAHDPKRLAANPAGRNAPDAGRAGRTVPPVAIVTGLGDRRKHGR